MSTHGPTDGLICSELHYWGSSSKDQEHMKKTWIVWLPVQPWRGSFIPDTVLSEALLLFLSLHPFWCADAGGCYIWVFINLTNTIHHFALVTPWDPPHPTCRPTLAPSSIFHKNDLYWFMLQSFLKFLVSLQTPNKHHLSLNYSIPLAKQVQAWH